MNRNYVLISPCRNEAKNMRQTLDSVIAQTVRPAKWIVIDDGSTDNTQEILNEYSSAHDWISIITLDDRGHRAVGPGVVDAFYRGYSSIRPEEYEYLCKLDMDLKLPEKYFETLIIRMEKNPRIGTCSGKSYVVQGNKLISERKGDETSLGMTKFYRVNCFKEIGGFVREVMWDGIDCHRCRMNGWVACSWDEPDLRFVHLRPMGSSQKNIFHGRMRHGYGQYFMGTGFVYMLASSINKMIEKPYLLGGCAMFLGWFNSAILRKPRYDDIEFREFLRAYQKDALLYGKKRAVEKIYRNKHVPWPLDL